MKIILRILFWILLLVLGMIVLTKTFPLPGTIPVLAYHSIGSREDAKEFKHFVSRESFQAQMAFLHFFGFRVISSEEYERIKTGIQAPRGREILITFDDANQTFETEAWPVLQRYHFPCLLFVITESLNQQVNGSMKPETLQGFLKTGQLALGSATKTHPSLPQTSNDQLWDEVSGSKQDLEKIFGGSILYFAYPNGDLDGTVIASVKEAGYRLGFTTSHHQLGAYDETLFALTRLNISRSSDDPIVFWVKATGIYQTHKHYWQALKQRLRHAIR